MAEHSTTGAPALSTDIESGKFDEKAAHHVPAAPATKPAIEDEEEDEDIDALIDDLESHDGHDQVSKPIEPAHTQSAPRRALVPPNHELQLGSVSSPRFSPRARCWRVAVDQLALPDGCASWRHHITFPSVQLQSNADNRFGSSRKRRRSPPVADVSSPRTCSRPTPASVSQATRSSSAVANMVSTR
jgi:hypothetical protein